jgi:DeoR family fructose operon transcriptional repressor
LRDRSLSVVTNSLDVLHVLFGSESTAVYCIGGRLRHEAASFVGPSAVAALESMHFDVAFLGTTGFSREGQLASQNTFESEVKRTALQRASRALVLADATKLGTHAFSVFAGCSEFDAIITDGTRDNYPFLGELGVEIITPDQKELS